MDFPCISYRSYVVSKIEKSILLIICISHYMNKKILTGAAILFGMTGSVFAAESCKEGFNSQEMKSIITVTQVLEKK